MLLWVHNNIIGQHCHDAAASPLYSMHIMRLSGKSSSQILCDCVEKACSNQWGAREAYLNVSTIQGVRPCAQEVPADHASMQPELLKLGQQPRDVMCCSIIHLSNPKTTSPLLVLKAYGETAHQQYTAMILAGEYN